MTNSVLQKQAENESLKQTKQLLFKGLFSFCFTGKTAGSPAELISPANQDLTPHALQPQTDPPQ